MTWEQTFAEIVAFIGTWGLRVVGVILALLVAWFLSGWLRNRLHASLKGKGLDETLAIFFSNMTRYAILVGTIVGCLGVFGIQTASFAAVLASAGLAVGLAFQGTLSNFAAGVMLVIFRPFKVGDVVNVAGQLGVVAAIDLFTTELTTPDNRCIILPNKNVFGATIENLTKHPLRRVDVKVGTAYEADVDETRRVLEAVAPTIPGVIEEPAPQVFLASLGASSVDWAVRVWCKTEDYWGVYQDGTRAVKRALDEAGVSIPYPQMDVHLDPPPSAD